MRLDDNSGAAPIRGKVTGEEPNYALGDWSNATPDKMRSWPEGKLLFAMQQNRGREYDTWARAELARRQNEHLGCLLETLTAATNAVAKGAEGLKQEVSSLASSSDRLETLTKKLNFLTVILVVLTICAVVVPIGIEVYHAKYDHKELSLPVVISPTPTTDPKSLQPSHASQTNQTDPLVVKP